MDHDLVMRVARAIHRASFEMDEIDDIRQMTDGDIDDDFDANWETYWCMATAAINAVKSSTKDGPYHSPISGERGVMTDRQLFLGQLILALIIVLMLIS